MNDTESDDLRAFDEAFGTHSARRMEDEESRESSDVTVRYVEPQAPPETRGRPSPDKEDWEKRVTKEGSMKAMATRAEKDAAAKRPHIHVFISSVCVACDARLDEMPWIKQFCGTGKVRFEGKTYFVSESGRIMTEVPERKRRRR